MPQARRMSQRLTDEERAAIRQETLAEVRSALDSADDYEEFKDAMFDDPGQTELSWDEVQNMDEATVNRLWPAVRETLARGPGGDVPVTFDHAQQQPPSARRATGQQLINEGGGGGAARVPLSRSALAAMTHEEITARKDEIDAWLSSGGGNR